MTVNHGDSSVSDEELIMYRKKAFTLIELLVVISVIALLLSILMPALTNIKRQAQAVICRSNLKQWGYVFTLYAYDNNDSFPQGYEGGGISAENAWLLGATLPYYRDLDMRMCPSSKPADRPPAVPQPGGTFLDWGPFPSSPDGNQWYDSFATGSYGFNQWCANPLAESSWWGLDHNNAIRKMTTKSPASIPLVLDSVYVDTATKDNDYAPDDTEHFNDVYNARWDVNAMKYYCIDRHKGGINAVFVDMGTRPVGIKELWLLKWHKNFFKRHEPLGGWPTWTDKYKDY